MDNSYWLKNTMMDISTLAEIFMQLSSTGIELEVLRALGILDVTTYVFK